jgi:hypothetical protein
MFYGSFPHLSYLTCFRSKPRCRIHAISPIRPAFARRKTNSMSSPFFYFVT